MAFMRDPFYILMQDGIVQINEFSFEQAATESTFDQAIFDDIVMMRYYNMTEEERRATIDRVLETQFATGADGIRKASGRLTVMDRAIKKGKT